ncbi:MAG: 2-oxoglutarate dehydrogenase, E2 component, dihydrolipoamide succinyltransferase, partial [Vulcanimicrobiaceae bacterium]
AAAPPRRSRAAPAAQPAPAAEPSPYAEAAVLQEAIAPQAAGESVSAERRLFEGRGELVRAVIAAEVLGTPIALRARERTQPLW